MAETNNFHVFAIISDPDVRTAIREHLDNYTGVFVFADRQTDNTLTFSANKVSQGSVDDCFEEFLDLIRDGVDEFRCPVCKGNGVQNHHSSDCLQCQGEGFYHLPVPDFAFSVNDEPQDEYLGMLRIHVPGLPDFSHNCDGNGNPVISAGEVMTLVNEATSLDVLRTELAGLTGQLHLEHLKPEGPQ